jgi:hypothetical protein
LACTPNDFILLQKVGNTASRHGYAFSRAVSSLIRGTASRVSGSRILKMRILWIGKPEAPA